MSERKPKSQKTYEQHVKHKNATQEKSKLVTITFPSNFPFKDLRCPKEHKDVFKALFGESNL